MWLLVVAAALVAFSFFATQYFRRQTVIFIKGRVVLITGAASGLGSLMAKKFAAEGATLVLWDIRLGPLQKFAEELKEEFQAKILCYECDVSNHEMVENVANQVKKDLGPEFVSILVNNAGIVSGRPFLELTPEHAKRTLSVNALSHFYMTRCFLRRMIRENQGVVVTVSSAMGLTGAVGLTDYCASKFALLGYHQSLRLELKRIGASGVHTLLVCPMAINTGMFDGIFEGPKRSLLQSLLFPMLSPMSVVNSIMAAIACGEQFLVLPRHMKYVAYICQMLPVPVFDWANFLLGGKHAMDNFRGRDWSNAAAKPADQKKEE